MKKKTQITSIFLVLTLIFTLILSSCGKNQNQIEVPLTVSIPQDEVRFNASYDSENKTLVYRSEDELCYIGDIAPAFISTCSSTEVNKELQIYMNTTKEYSIVLALSDAVTSGAVDKIIFDDYTINFTRKDGQVVKSYCEDDSGNINQFTYSYDKDGNLVKYTLIFSGVNEESSADVVITISNGKVVNIQTVGAPYGIVFNHLTNTLSSAEDIGSHITYSYVFDEEGNITSFTTTSRSRTSINAYTYQEGRISQINIDDDTYSITWGTLSA